MMKKGMIRGRDHTRLPVTADFYWPRGCGIREWGCHNVVLPADLVVFCLASFHWIYDSAFVY